MTTQESSLAVFSHLLNEPWQAHEIHGLLGSIFIFNAADALCTIVWLESGLATEANPLLAWMFAFHPALFFVAKMTLVALGLVLLARYRHHALARGGAYLLFMLFTLLICYHIAGGILFG